MECIVLAVSAAHDAVEVYHCGVGTQKRKILVLSGESGKTSTTADA